MGSVANISSFRVSSSGSTISDSNDWSCILLNVRLVHYHTHRGCKDAASGPARMPSRQHMGTRHVAGIADTLTSDLSTSIVRSFDTGPMRSISWLRLSALHTDTRFPVTLCVADCTRQGPTLNGGACAAAAGRAALEELDGPGVDVLLPMAEPPIL